MDSAVNLESTFNNSLHSHPHSPIIVNAPTGTQPCSTNYDLRGKVPASAVLPPSESSYTIVLTTFNYNGASTSNNYANISGVDSSVQTRNMTHLINAMYSSNDENSDSCFEGSLNNSSDSETEHIYDHVNAHLQGKCIVSKHAQYIHGF